MFYSALQMWACAKGHNETALILYKWNHNALNVRNLIKRTPIDVAMDNGFQELAAELERLESKRKLNDPPQLFPTSFASLKSAASDTAKVTTVNCSEFNAFNTSMYDISTSQLIADSDADKNELRESATEALLNSQINEYLDNSSPKSVESQHSQNSNRSHDGVFLRPGAVNTR